jgi:hypothetical protein
MVSDCNFGAKSQSDTIVQRIPVASSCAQHLDIMARLFFLREPVAEGFARAARAAGQFPDPT